MYFLSIFHSKNNRLIAAAIVGFLLLIGGTVIAVTPRDDRDVGSSAALSNNVTDKTTPGEEQHQVSAVSITGDSTHKTEAEGRNAAPESPVAQPAEQNNPRPALPVSPAPSIISHPAPSASALCESKFHYSCYQDWEQIDLLDQ